MESGANWEGRTDVYTRLCKRDGYWEAAIGQGARPSALRWPRGWLGGSSEAAVYVHTEPVRVP